MRERTGLVWALSYQNDSAPRGLRELIQFHLDGDGCATDEVAATENIHEYTSSVAHIRYYWHATRRI